MRRLRITKWVILAHRYLGIALSLLIVVWFASGIVMMYAGGMPRLTPQLRLDRLPPLDLTRVHLTPADAAERARQARAAGRDAPARPPGGRIAGPPRTQLLTVMDRPAYRVGGTTVFADTGELLSTVSLDEAKAIVAKFMDVPDARVEHVRTLDRIDQWTLGQSRALPLHKFRVDDADGSELYVQPASGEIAAFTTRKSRLLAWMGTIPHWLYFAALRENQPLWYRIVVWTSAAACLLTVLGLVLAVTRFRKVRPFSFSKAIPYSGLMRWHYITGSVFGIFALTWSFSGLLSMEPFAWTNARGLEMPRDVFTGGPVDLAAFKAMEPRAWQRILAGRAIKEVEFVRIQGDHYYQVRQGPLAASGERPRERLHQPYYVTGQADPDRVLVDADTLKVRWEPFSPESMIARLEAAAPNAPIAATDLLSDYDAYYYSRSRQTPLPVLRVKFSDPAETWVYVDPQTSQMLAQIHRLARVERWLYNGLHSLDFPFWYDKRPLWDIAMLTLLAGGLASSCLGLVVGLTRVSRWAGRLVNSTSPAGSSSAGGPLETPSVPSHRHERPISSGHDSPAI